jgi:hypothetical protein
MRPANQIEISLLDDDAGEPDHPDRPGHAPSTRRAAAPMAFVVGVDVSETKEPHWPKHTLKKHTLKSNDRSTRADREQPPRVKSARSEWSWARMRLHTIIIVTKTVNDRRGSVMSETPRD